MIQKIDEDPVAAEQRKSKAEKHEAEIRHCGNRWEVFVVKVAHTQPKCICMP
jgi:hypothetical protein